MLCLKIAGWLANSVDPDETPHSVASHLGLLCLLRPVCPNTYGKYSSSYEQNAEYCSSEKGHAQHYNHGHDLLN